MVWVGDTGKAWANYTATWRTPPPPPEELDFQGTKLLLMPNSISLTKTLWERLFVSPFDAWED
jgi:hypothetical protein